MAQRQEEWEEITPEEAGEWEEFIPTEEVSSFGSNTIKEQPKPGFLGKAWDAATTPLSNAPSRFAESVLGASPTGGIFDAIGSIPDVARNMIREPLATMKGGLQGGLQGIADLVSQETSPLAIGSNILGISRPIRKGISGAIGNISNRIRGGARVADEISIPKMFEKQLPTGEDIPGTEMRTDIPIKHITDEIPKPLTATEKLRESLKEVPGKIKEQETITTAERAKKFAEIGEVETPGRAGYFEELGKLKGEVPKVTGSPLKLETSEIDELYDSIKGAIPDKPTSIRARGAVEKLMRGEIPQQNELDTLESYLAFISEEPGTAKQITARSKLREVYELARGFMSVDLPFMTSAAFRQSAPMVGKSQWFEAFANGARSFGNEGTYNSIMDALQKSPIHRKRFLGSKITNIADEIGLAQSDLKTLTSREEQIRSTLAERMPVWGKYVRANNRAFTAFQNTIRTRTAEDWLKAAGAINAEGNITNLVEAKKLANTINELTGHGSLKIAQPFSRFTKSGNEYNLERAADTLSLIFWSPRLMARDMRMMNPLNYIKTEKLDRLKYLEGAVRRAGVWATFTGLASGLGARVNSDPTSSDFGKARIGDTRLDAGSGLLQWIVLSARQLTGERTSSASNRTTEFGSNILAGTRQSAFEEFFKNRIHPSLSLPISFLSASKGRPFYPMSEVAEKLTPIPIQDLTELMQSNPEIEQILMSLVGSSLAMGASTYGVRDFGKPQFNIPGDVPFEGGRLFGR